MDCVHEELYGIRYSIYSSVMEWGWVHVDCTLQWKRLCVNAALEKDGGKGKRGDNDYKKGNSEQKSKTVS